MTLLELLGKMIAAPEMAMLPQQNRLTSVSVGPGYLRFELGTYSYRYGISDPANDLLELIADEGLDGLLPIARRLLRVPLVIRDRRPTREEVERAMVDGRAYFLHSGHGRMRLLWYDADRHGGVPKLNDEGFPAPGEVWRAINPDGSPVMVVEEV